MTNEPFLLVSLEESESKDLAQAISNKSARKILDYLSKNDSATETDISKELKIPISTVHYNLQALTKANLIIAEEFHYSEKGKEVLHYKLANKLIIIASKKASKESFLQKIKAIIPIGIIALATGAVLQLFSRSAKTFGSAGSQASFGAPMLKTVVDESIVDAAAGGAQEVMRALPEAAPMMMEVADAAIHSASNAVQNASQNITQIISQNISHNVTEPAQVIVREVFIPVSQQANPPSIALWFLIGAGFTLLLLIIWYWFVTRKDKNKIKKKR